MVEMSKEERRWRCCECGYQSKDYDTVLSHAKHEHGPGAKIEGTIIEEIDDDRNHPFLSKSEIEALFDDLHDLDRITYQTLTAGGIAFAIVIIVIFLELCL